MYKLYLYYIRGDEEETVKQVKSFASELEADDYQLTMLEVLDTLGGHFVDAVLKKVRFR